MRSLKTIMLVFALLLLPTTACGAPAPETPPAGPTSDPVSDLPMPAPTDRPPVTEASVELSGMSPENPFPFAEAVITPEWEVRVLETVRGGEAMEMLEQVSAFNDAPETGMEYLLVKVQVKYVGSNASAHVYEKIFRSLGSAGEIYKSLSFVKVKVPEPALEADLAPGEKIEGWIAFQVGQEESGIMLVVWPYVSYENNTAMFSDSSDKWYISLE